MRRVLKIIAFPLAVLAVFGLLYAVWLAVDLPPEETMIAAAKYYLDRYGIVIVLISAYLEGLLLIGWYFPGTLVIILALVFAAPDPLHTAQVAAVAGAGLFSAYVTNFFAGKYGWVRGVPALRARGAPGDAPRGGCPKRPRAALSPPLSGHPCPLHFLPPPAPPGSRP